MINTTFAVEYAAEIYEVSLLPWAYSSSTHYAKNRMFHWFLWFCKANISFFLWNPYLDLRITRQWPWLFYALKCMSCPAVINWVANLAMVIRECDTACLMYWHCFEIVAETVWHRWRQINSSSIALALLKPLVLPSTASRYSLTNAYKLNS